MDYQFDLHRINKDLFGPPDIKDAPLVHAILAVAERIEVLVDLAVQVAEVDGESET